MSEPCTFLQWDTDFFGCRIGRVNVDQLDVATQAEINAWVAANHVDCLYFLADADHTPTIRHCEAHGYAFQGVRLTLALARPARAGQGVPPMAENGVQYRTARPDDLPALRPLVQSAYTLSRFYTDERFSDERCAALYDTWLTRSINAGFADAVFVAEAANDHSAVGFVTCKLDERQRGLIPLVGVAEQARGRRVGANLLQHALGWFWGRTLANVQQVRVVTQGHNIAAQRLYQRAGFLTHEVGLWYHRWYTACTSSNHM